MRPLFDCNACRKFRSVRHAAGKCRPSFSLVRRTDILSGADSFIRARARVPVNGRPHGRPRKRVALSRRAIARETQRVIRWSLKNNKGRIRPSAARPHSPAPRPVYRAAAGASASAFPGAGSAHQKMGRGTDCPRRGVQYRSRQRS
jgi:hypothetical protein